MHYGLVESADHASGAEVDRPWKADASTIDPVSEATADRFAQLALELHSSQGAEETIEELVHFALQALNCSHAGVALAASGKPEIPAVTEPVVAEISESQLNGGVGPLAHTMRERVTTLVSDTATDQRWPDWATRVQALGLRSVLHVPLSIAPESVGVLGLYSPEPNAFSEDDEAVAHLLARHAAVTLAAARHEDALSRVVDARELVGMAMGILMERYDIDEAHAFDLLSHYSQETNTKLHDVAQWLVEGRRLPFGA